MHASLDRWNKLKKNAICINTFRNWSGEDGALRKSEKDPTELHLH